MFTPLVLFFSCVALSGAQTYEDLEKECGPNEVFSLCVDPCQGEDSCYDRNQIICGAVLRSCRPGCVCKDGFIRKTIYRECIPKEECGGPCEIFSHYTECKQISKETCSSILNPPKSDDSTETCTPGCTCWDGYYRENETSSCVPRCLCPEVENSPDCNS